MKILWPKSGWLPQDFLDIMPKTLQKMGLDIVFKENWVLPGDEVVIDNNYDLIFCHGPQVSRYFLSPKNIQKDTPPQIHHVWDIALFRRWSSYNWGFTKRYVKKIKQKAFAVCCYTQTVAKELKEYFDIDAVPQLSYFDNQKVDSVADQPKGNYIIGAGSQRDNKNFYLLVLAVSILEKKYRPKVVLVGEKGWFTNQTIKIAKALEVDLEVIGELASHEEVIKLIKGAQLLVHPSCYEGFGLPPKEAIWAGVPTIVGDIPVMREVHGENMAYFNIVDPYSIYHYLHLIFIQKKPLPYSLEEAKQQLMPYTIESQAGKFKKYITKIYERLNK